MSMSDPLGDMLTRIRNGQMQVKQLFPARLHVPHECSRSSKAGRIYPQLFFN